MAHEKRKRKKKSGKRERTEGVWTSGRKARPPPSELQLKAILYHTIMIDGSKRRGGGNVGLQ